MTAEQNTATSDALLASILSQLDDDKAEEVVQIDLRGKTAIGDYMVVCSGRSSRQVSAIAEKLAQMVKDDYGRSPKVEGKETRSPSRDAALSCLSGRVHACSHLCGRAFARRTGKRPH